MSTMMKVMMMNMFCFVHVIVFSMRASAFNYDVQTVEIAPPSKLGRNDVMPFSFLIKPNATTNEL